MVDVFKCLIIAVVVLLPMWIMTEELDGDEFEKSAVGIAAGGVMLGGLKILEQFLKRNGKNGDKS